uniref:Non-specific protein-tyrosine kinase n=1 Tax=Parascaris univalens TaxID=6257 RepID=A0A914ZLD7_PARUN
HVNIVRMYGVAVDYEPLMIIIELAKISDFGLSREGCIYRMKGSKKVPIKWTAPETLSTFTYTLKTDVFAFSILVWEVF